jgi:hypothetical protein
MGYHLEGKLLEVCNCEVLCPCWIGEDPDNGICQSIMAWNFDKGEIDGIDVSGLTIGALVHIPGNVLDGNWKAAIYVDEKATDEQNDAILSVWSGKAGGPVAELVQLVGEVVSAERVAIQFDVAGGAGTVSIGNSAFAEMETYKGPDGATTTLSNSIFSTVPGSPAFVSKASTFKAKNKAAGVDQDLSGHNAIQSTFRFDH